MALRLLNQVGGFGNVHHRRSSVRIFKNDLANAGNSWC